MKICVIGLGFVGLTMATVIASKGFKVIGADNDKEKVSMIRQGKAPFFEPNVKELLGKTLGNHFEATDNLKDAVLKSDTVFICVGTPSNPDGSVNLSFIKKVCQEIGQILKENKKFKTIIVKSTVPPLTTNGLVKQTLEKYSSKKSDSDFGLCMNPEFLREGNAVEDMLSPHLIVIGTNDERTKKNMHEFYKSLYPEKLPKILDTNIINSEIIKLANNSFLATKISFINTIANICNQIEGADVEVIAKAIGFDPRIGPLFLRAGPGYGGSCFPKDVSGFLNFSNSLGYHPLLLESTQKVNEDQPNIIMNMIEKKIKNFEDKTISILGLAFKKNTDDIRDSVATKIVNSLLEKKAVVKVHDPMAIENFKKKIGDKIIYCDNPIDCLKSSDCCIVLTEWDVYRQLSANDFKKNMKSPCIIDARRIFNPKEMHTIDFSAIGYGGKF